MSANPHYRFNRRFRFGDPFRAATGRERYLDSSVHHGSDAPFRSRLGIGFPREVMP